MFTRFFQKPQLFFFGIAIITLLIAILYLYFFPDAYFDMGGDYPFTVSCSSCWFLFSGYTLFLAGIYYVAAKGKLRTRRWLVMLHFIFVILFLLLFFAFSAFNTEYVQSRVSGLSFFTAMFVYGMVFLLDLITFVISLILLLANVFSLRKPRT